jgi:hypothetical protein
MITAQAIELKSRIDPIETTELELEPGIRDIPDTKQVATRHHPRQVKTEVPVQIQKL